MKQNGRKPLGALSVVSQIIDHRPSPPDVLSESEAATWREITQTKPADWWDAGSVLLLTEYCRLKTSIDILNAQLVKAEATIEATGELPDGYKAAAGILDKKQGRMVQIAMKMRLTQQARYDKTKASTETKKASPARVWERG